MKDDSMIDDSKLLRVNNLSVSFHGGNGAVEVVKHVSFEMRKGEMLALVGESGSGKSVTALSVMQLLPYPAAFHPSGSIMFEGQELVGKGDMVMQTIRGARIGMIFQEPQTALNPLHKIGQQIAECLIVHRSVTAAGVNARVQELLQQVGLSHFTDRLDAYPHQLSGGERQRVMIAMALANNPSLLIADEPTTALDVTTQQQILKLLAELQKKLGLAILLITHDLTLVRKMADRVAIMKQGEIVEIGETKSVFAAPQHAYTKLLITSEPKGQAVSLQKDRADILSITQLAIRFPIRRGFFQRIKGYVEAVKPMDLHLSQGETLGIVGESGSGKTTLALALLRLIKGEGKIVFCGSPVEAMQGNQLKPLRRQMQIVFQDPFGSLNPRMSIEEIIGEGLVIHEPGLNESVRTARVEEILKEVGLNPDVMHRYPHEFSGGQRQRIAIARAMILKPKFVVLDEPTSALDLTLQAQILDLLKSLQSKYGISYIFISHDLRAVRAIAHRVMVMKKGDIVEQGSAEQIFTAPQQEYTQLLLKAAFA